MNYNVLNKKFGPIEYYHDNIIYHYGNNIGGDDWHGYYFVPYLYPYKVVDKTAKIIRIENRLYINGIFYCCHDVSESYGFFLELKHCMPYLEHIMCSSYHDYDFSFYLQSKDGALYLIIKDTKILIVYPENKKDKIYIYDNKTKFPYTNFMCIPKHYECALSSLFQNKYLKLLVLPDNFSDRDAFYLEHFDKKIDYSKTLYITNTSYNTLLKCRCIPNEKHSRIYYRKYSYKIIEI